jgi:hypothetical protein
MSTTYTWEKWNAVATSVAVYNGLYSVTASAFDGRELSTGYTIANGRFYLNAPITIYSYATAPSALDGKYTFYYRYTYTKLHYVYGIDSYSGDANFAQYIIGTAYVKGDTYYGTVESTTAGAYPNGGVSGDYWYGNMTSVTVPDVYAKQNGAWVVSSGRLAKQNGAWTSGSELYKQNGAWVV